MQRRKLRRSIRRNMGMITLIATLSLSGGVARLHLHTKKRYVGPLGQHS